MNEDQSNTRRFEGPEIGEKKGKCRVRIVTRDNVSKCFCYRLWNCHVFEPACMREHECVCECPLPFNEWKQRQQQQTRNVVELEQDCATVEEVEFIE